MKIKRTRNVHQLVTGAFIATMGMLIGIIVGITIAPRHDYSPCLDLAKQDKLVVSQDGVITDLAIDTMNGRNYVYNKSLAQCLDLRK